MNIDRTHGRWIIAVLLLTTVSSILYALMPCGTRGSSRLGLLFAVCGTGLMAFAGILPLGKKLARWKLIRLPTLQKGHIWLGLLSVPMVLFHGGFRPGGPLSMMLLAVLGAIVTSGVLGLLFQHLLPLIKLGKEGKAKAAATIISACHRASLLLHIPLASVLLVLLVAHAVMSLYF